jgi:hypothetical protein
MIQERHGCEWSEDPTAVIRSAFDATQGSQTLSTTVSPKTTVAQRHSRTGAPLLPPVLAYAVLTIAGVVVPQLMSGVRPWTSDSAALDFFRNHAGAAHASAFLTLGAAIPLAVLTAIASTRIRTLGFDVPGRIIAQVGGAIAASLLAVAGLATLALTQSNVADSAANVRSFQALTFAAGGPGYVVFSGLLILGLAIPALLGSLLPRWVAWAGVAVAAVCEAASLSAAFDGLDVLLPVGRFGGLAWLVVLAFTLPANRRELNARRS